MKQQEEIGDSQYKVSGVWYAIIAFLTWGVFPLYWKPLKVVPAIEILAHRVFWSFVFMVILTFYYNQWNELKAVLIKPRKRLAVILSSLLVSLNWGLYIWAVNAGHIVDASLGYYINPLLSVCLGMLVLKERLNFWQWISLLMAAGGVLIFGVQYGKIPWIALSLALSFGSYGLVKKMANIESIIGLTLETAVMTPLAAGYLLWLQFHGFGAFGNSPLWITLMLAGAGIVTAVPLIWFTRATQRVPLSVVGFIQYLTPTMILFLGVFLYHETFSPVHLIGFGTIWAALLLFSCSHFKFMQRYQPSRFKGRQDIVELPVTEEL